MTGQSYRRLLELAQLGDSREHGPFANQKQGGKGQQRVMIQKTEARREKRGEEQAAKEEGKGARGLPASASIQREAERAEHAQASPRMKAAEGPGLPVKECGKAPGALLKNLRHQSKVLSNSRRWLLGLARDAVYL